MLKLLGFDSEGVVRLIVVETLLTAVLGAGAGLALAALVLTVAHPAISIEGYTITPVMTQQVLCLGLAAGVLLGYFGALWPPVLRRGCRSSRRSRRWTDAACH